MNNIQKFIEFEGLKPGCYSLSTGESFFSFQSCDCCKSTLGGQRYTIEAVTMNGEIFDYDICEDCYLKLFNE